MKNPNAKIIGFFGYAEGAHLYNITFRDLDISTAGSGTTGIFSNATCAIQIDCNIYDITIYKKQH